MDSKHELLICIVNAGFSDEVMDAARSCGARGGTVINARGTAKQDVANKFNISIHPEKELILILVNTKIKEDIMHSIYQNVGPNTEGQGLVFSLPVDEVIGFKKLTKIEKGKTE